MPVAGLERWTRGRSVDVLNRRIPVGYSICAGAVAGGIAVGSGILASRLQEMAPLIGTAEVLEDGTPSWLWWLSIEWLGSNQPTVLVIVVSSMTIVLGMVAGVVSRQRSWPGSVVLLLLGFGAVWEVWSTNTGVRHLLVPLVATASGVIALGVLLRLARTSGAHRAAHARSPSTRDGHRAMPEVDNGPWRGAPRRAVLGGVLLALGSGTAALLLPTNPVRSQTRSSALARTAVGAPSDGGQPLLRGKVVNVRDFGATGDGRTDDSIAIRRALDDANSLRGTLYFPSGTYRYSSDSTLDLQTGITLSGVPGRSRLDFARADASGFLLGCGINGDDITVDGLTLRRVADFDAVLIGTGAFNRLTISRTTLVGGMDQFPGSYCHGIKFSDSDESTGLHIVDSTITRTEYGLFQTNQSTASTVGILVERCSFTQNYNTDLEFNSPHGAMSKVVVQANAFSNNDSPGFGVGFANVSDVDVRNNSFENYAMEAVHVEDYSSGVRVNDNDFTACGLRMHSHVQILSGAHDVVLDGNTFHADMNTNEIYAVTSQPGGVGQTGSDRRIVAPSRVSLRNNTFRCSAAVKPVYLQGGAASSITGSIIEGADITGPADAFDLSDPSSATVSNNVINGQRF